MTENERILAVVHELRAMAVAGENVPSLLRCVQRSLGRTDCKLVSVQCFHKAFNAGIASVSPIAGWCGFGGQLTDTEVDSLVGVVLNNYRESVASEVGSPH